MAITAIQPQPMFNPYSTTDSIYGSVPGDANTGFFVRDIAEKVDAIYPKEFEFLSMIPKGSPRTQLTVEWQQDRVLPFNGTLGALIASGAQGDQVTITLVDVKPVQQYMTFKIDNEIFWVNGAPNTANNTVTAIRGQGGSAAVGHTNGSNVIYSGTALPYMQNFVASPTAYGDFDFNYFQRFEGGQYGDLAYDVMRDLKYTSGDQIAKKLAAEAWRQKGLLNLALIHGLGQKGVPDPNPANRRPAMMRGVPDLIRTNVTDLSTAGSGGTPGLLTYGLFEDDQAKIQTKTGDLPDTYIMSYKTKRILSRLVKTRDATMDDDRVSLVIKEAEFDTGVVKFVSVRDWPDGLIISFDKRKVELIPKKGLDWHERDIPVFGDHKFRTISGDFTVILKGEESLSKITGFSTDLTQYPAVSFGHL